MLKREMIYRLQRAIEILETLPDDVHVISVDAYGTEFEARIHLMRLPDGLKATATKERHSLEQMQYAANIGGVKVFALNKEAVPEGV